MKYWSVILLFIVSCSTAHQRSPSSDPYRLVFDIDWTITSQVDEAFYRRYPEKVIKVGEEYFRAHDGLVQVLQSLAEDPRFEIYFFSGGHKERNLELLDKIKLGEADNALSVSKGVFHSSDLTDLRGDVGEGARFSEKYKKDLRMISPEKYQMDNTVIFDDNHFFAPDLEQRKHFLWLDPSYNHYETWADAKAASKKYPTDNYIPKTFEQWSLHRNKMAMIFGVVEEAADGEGGTFAERVRLLWDRLNLAKGTYSKDAFKYHERFRAKKGGLKLPPRDDCFFMVNMLL